MCRGSSEAVRHQRFLVEVECLLLTRVENGHFHASPLLFLLLLLVQPHFILRLYHSPQRGRHQLHLSLSQLPCRSFSILLSSSALSHQPPLLRLPARSSLSFQLLQAH